MILKLNKLVLILASIFICAACYGDNMHGHQDFYDLSKEILFEEWIFENSSIPDSINDFTILSAPKPHGETRIEFWGKDRVIINIWKHGAATGGENYTIKGNYSYNPRTKEVKLSYNKNDGSGDAYALLKITGQPEEHIIEVELYSCKESGEKTLIGNMPANRIHIMPLEI